MLSHNWINFHRKVRVCFEALQVGECLLQLFYENTVFDEIVAAVVDTDVLEEVSPVLVLLVKDCLGSVVGLDTGIPEDEVLDIHVLIDVVFQFIVFDLARAVRIDILEHAGDVFSDKHLGWCRQASQLGEAVDGCS